MRDYPELNKENIGQEQVNAIGFELPYRPDDEYYDED
jgi:hypothetical protein